MFFHAGVGEGCFTKTSLLLPPTYETSKQKAHTKLEIIRE